jgi:outer membrane protein OmpA-like peptidoglycan-associated protein
VGLADKDSDFIGEHIVGADAQLHFHFLRNPDRFMPYLLAGAGFVWQGKESTNIQAPAGIGLDVKLTEKAFFNLQGEFRWSSAENNNNFNYGIGFKYFLGPVEQEMPAPVDSDMDGIPDIADECPLVPGLEVFSGCPDTDGDQIPDPKDECPNEAGVMAFMGCPDTDVDGLPDHQDACPTEAGPISNNGCPVEVKQDSDMDGIVDDEDRCPDVAGLLQFGGCPDRDGDGIEDLADSCPDKAGPVQYNGCPDTDGDGLPDPKDSCPNSPGPVDNNGCPYIDKQDREVLTFAMRAVQFELGKAALKPESNKILDQIAVILKKYPDYRLSIEGHTDNTGAEDANLKLSEARAKSCHDYLVQKGIPDDRLDYKGYGESRPVADNATYSGRTLNRRVEFNVIPPK